MAIHSEFSYLKGWFSRIMLAWQRVRCNYVMNGCKESPAFGVISGRVTSLESPRNRACHEKRPPSMGSSRFGLYNSHPGAGGTCFRQNQAAYGGVVGTIGVRWCKYTISMVCLKWLYPSYGLLIVDTVVSFNGSPAQGIRDKMEFHASLPFGNHPCQKWGFQTPMSSFQRLITVGFCKENWFLVIVRPIVTNYVRLCIYQLTGSNNC